MRILLAGGGTGGHLYPILSVIKALRRREPAAELLLIGARKGLDADLLPQQGLPYRLIPAMPLTRRPISEFVQGVLGCTAATAVSFGILRRFRPDVIFSTGAHVGGCICIAARALRIPYVLHESDAVAGHANKTLASGAARITVAFEAALRHLPPGKGVYTGQPVREEIGKADRHQARAELGLEEGRKTLLVTGGSRGARTINEALLGALPLLADEPKLQILHITGTLDADSIRARLDSGEVAAPPWYQMRPYAENMPQALAASDLVVGRSGSSSLAEFALCGLPAILVPYPFAAQQHQLANAKAFEDAGAARVILNPDCTPKALAAALLELLHDGSRLAQMADAARRLARPDAAERVVEVLLGVVQGRGRAGW